MSEFFVADVSLAVIFALLLLANFAVMFKLNTYKSISPGFVSIGIILLLLTRVTYLIYDAREEVELVKTWEIPLIARIL